MISRKTRIVCYALFFLAWLNFAAFIFISLWIGGDAVSGRIEDGKYYVRNRHQYTEVSRQVFLYSKYHVYLVWILHPIGLLSLAYVAFKDRGVQDLA